MASPAEPCTGAVPRDLKPVDGSALGSLPDQSSSFAFGYDMEMAYHVDGLGILYISIAIAWTCLLLPVCAFLMQNRQLPYLRIRNIPLAVGAVGTLHVYWILCLLAYVFNGYFPCSSEYWIMSIYLPLGIALFQAANSQLLSVATAQKQYAQDDISIREKGDVYPKVQGWRRYWQKLKAYNATKNTLVWICIGIAVQMLLAFVIFMASRKFHPGFGSTGSPSPDNAEGRAQCRRGWEWWPSAAWQFLWSWVYAPILLWRVRDIHDVVGWRLQTVACVLAGLPASPMWMIALYVPEMAAVNKYFVPPLWFTGSICIMQASVVFVPFWQVFKHRRLETETREIIAEWEEKHHGTSVHSGSTSSTSKARSSTRSSVKSTASSRQGEMYTMGALEKTLKVNPTPLLMFSALKDFSGENISFLTHVRDWKADWANSNPRNTLRRKQSVGLVRDDALRRQQFKRAVGIYASFVSTKYSDFPINISSTHLKELENVFEHYAALVCANPAGNAATPFETYMSTTSEDLESGNGKYQVSAVTTSVGDDRENALLGGVRSSQQHQLKGLKMTNFGARMPNDIKIPNNFNPEVFDHAELSIKELVLTNTWAKFVKAGFAQSTVPQTASEKLRDVAVACRTGWIDFFQKSKSTSGRNPV